MPLSGIAHIIGQAATGALNPDFGAQIHRQRFEAGQQLQRLNHIRRTELSENAGKNADYYGGVGSPTGRQLHALSQEVLSYPDDQNLDANIAKAQARYAQLVSAGEKELAQSHAGNTPGAPIGPVGASAAPTPTNANSGVFGKFIGPGAVEASPLPGALPTTSPVSPAAQPALGGGPQANASFPGPASRNPALSAGDAAAPKPVQSAPVAPSAAVASPAPIAPVGPNIQADVDEFNRTGYMSPVLRGMLPGQTALYQGQQKLPLVQKIMDEIGPISDENGFPDMRKLMQADAKLSALGVTAPNLAPMLLQMLAPANETGAQTWGELRPEAKALYAAAHPGEDISKIDPNTPVREQVNKFTRKPIGVQIQSVPLQVRQFAEGPFNFNPRTGRYDPVPGLTPIGMVPHEGMMLVNQADGSQKLIAIETGKKQIAQGRATLAPNSVYNSQPDVVQAMQGVVGPVAPSAPPAKPPAAGAPGVTARPSGLGGGRFSAVTGAGSGATVGNAHLPAEAQLQYKNAITDASRLIWGDPDDPALHPLVSFAHLADDPDAKRRISTYLNLALKYENVNGDTGIGGSLGPVSVSSGGIGGLISNLTGLRKREAEADAATMRNAMDDMERNHPEEANYINTLMATFPAVTGFRKITSGSAFKWTQTALERELPLIGIGTTSSRQFLDKTHVLGNGPVVGIANATKYIPDFDPRLVARIKANGGTQPIQGVQGAPPPVAHWGRDAHGNPVRLQ